MLCLVAAVVVSKSGPTWYGPVTVTMPISYVGDPYDPADNDVTVDFVSDRGRKEHRLAYFVGDGKFSSTLVAPAKGRYLAHFMLNGKEVSVAPSPATVDEPLKHGFIGLKGKRFAWTDGTPYFPIGYDYAWQGVPNETVAQGMTKMGKSGANWSRIWACHWDNKNPFFPEPGKKLPGRELRQEPLKNWDSIVAAAEAADVHFQFTLFHHGPYSTTTDSNWKEHPWNTANGGFLKDPTDFFSDPEAKRRTKIWLRYAVARYAHSPAVMAWELFNEVQWVDAIKKNPGRVGDVAIWHKEMAEYVKSLDPYHHPVTSSSSESLDSHVFDAMDYMQPHTYPANVLAAIGGYKFKDKPGFFGEFGPPGGGSRSGPNAANYRKLVRDGIYGGILAGHAGAGMYWFWDQVDRDGLAADYLAARKVIDESGLLAHPEAKPFTVWIDTPHRSDMMVSAGGGWAKSSLFELDLPKVDPLALGGWSQYFQSIDHGQPGWGKPFVIRFAASLAGKMTLNIGQISSKGGTLTATVNGTKVLDERFAPPAQGTGGGFGRAPRPPVQVAYPAGQVEVKLENHGDDWIQLNSITVPGIGSTASGHGMSDGNWALIRIFGSDTSVAFVSGMKLSNGMYSVIVFDTATGDRTERTVEVKSGGFQAFNLPPDCVLALKRQ